MPFLIFVSLGKSRGAHTCSAAFCASTRAERKILVAEIVKSAQLRAAELDAAWWTEEKVKRALVNLDQKEKRAKKKAAGTP